MNHDRLIESLSAQLTPVRPLDQRRTIAWSVLGGALLTSVAATLLALPSRESFDDLYRFGWAGANQLLSGALAVVAALAVLRARVPGARGIPFAWGAAALGFFTFAAVDFAGVAAHARIGFHCSEQILFLLLLPGLAGAWVLKQGAPVRPVEAGAWLAVFSVAVAAFALPFSCPYADPTHLIVSHVQVPLLPVAAVGALVARRVFRW